MSALAARRAASASSTPQLPIEVPVGPVAPQGKRTRASSPQVDVDGNGSRRIGDAPTAAKSPKRAAKKTIVAQGSNAPRYFVPDPQEIVHGDTPRSRKGKARAFSPSHPVGDPYESSDGESSVDLLPEQNGGQPGVSVEYRSPAAPGPSKPRPGSLAAAATSNFSIQEGINVHRIDPGIYKAQFGADESSGVMISLAEDESISLSGSSSVSPLIGRIDIFSTTLCPSGPNQPPKRHHVFAPTSHPIPSITSSPSSQLAPDDSTFRREWNLPQSFALPSSKRHGAIFILSELHSGIDGLANGIVPGFNNIWPRGSFAGLNGMTLVSYAIVHAIRLTIQVDGGFSSNVYPYAALTSWSSAQRTLSAVDGTPVVLVRGPKRCGKSTFARGTLNMLLESHAEVAWLECDLGQSEFSPGGVVGLWSIKAPVLGPSFTHPRIPVKAQYLGEYTPLPCPDEYLASIRQLLQYYKYEMPPVPLVVNTQGWIKGLGEDLLREVEFASEPTHIFTFEADQVVDEYSGPGWTSSPVAELAPLPSHGSETIHRTLEPAPISPIQSRFTASDLRILSMMAYFHSTLQPSPMWDFETPLMEQLPWKVALGPQGAIRNVYLIGEGSEGVLSEDLPLALNGSIVGLLRAEPSPTLYEPGRSLSDLEPTSYIGMAIIRGIMPTANGFQLQLLTPLPHEVLGQVTSIVKNGSVELPLCVLLEGRNATDRSSDDLPFVDFSGVEGVGVEKRRFRRNIMRKGM